MLTAESRVGPYGRLIVAEDGTARRVLNPEGTAFVAGWIAAYPQMRRFAFAFLPTITDMFMRDCDADKLELECVCREAVVMAAMTHEPAVGKFSTWLKYHVRNALSGRIRSERKRPRTTKIRRPWTPTDIHGDDDDGPNVWGDYLSELPGRPDAEPSGCGLEDLDDRVRRAIKSRIVSLRTRRIFAMRRGLDGYDDMTIDQVSRVMKITRERVRQIEANVMHKIRKNLDDFADLYRSHFGEEPYTVSPS